MLQEKSTKTWQLSLNKKIENERKKYCKKKFAFDELEPTNAVEPRLPASDAAQQHMHRSYINDSLHHEKITFIRDKATTSNSLINLNYEQRKNLYPDSFPYFVRGRDSTRKYITSLFTSQIAIYDGDMSKMIQKHQLNENEYRGNRFVDWKCKLNGIHDVLSISQPQIVRNIYKEYLEVGGSNLIGTNTFSSTRISLADYEIQNFAYELNYEGARLAREVCDEVTAKDPTKPRFVVGIIGPTNRRGSISSFFDDSSARDVTYDELIEAYFEQIVGLVDGGSDILMVDTIFDTLNAKAALFALDEYLEYTGIDIPLFISGSFSDQSGRIASCQSVEAFYASIRHANPMCVGLNCVIGANRMIPFVEKLSRVAECFMHVISNDSSMNSMSVNDSAPEDMTRETEIILKNGWLNMVGGCCGSTPKHIKTVREMTAKYEPRKLPDVGRPKMWLAGLEDLVVDDVVNNLGLPFMNIGERCNISGLVKSKKMMMTEDYRLAMDIAKKQISDGVHVININVGSTLLDVSTAMEKFVKLAVSHPEVSKVPFMLSASHFDVLMAGVKWCQGKCIVNSISLDEGVEKFKAKATLLKKHGVAVVVMAFDAVGQSVSKDEIVNTCKRSYDILVDEVKFPPEDIIFDLTILITGRDAQDDANYFVDFMNAVEKIKHICPYVKISCCISKLSSRFCGATKIRKAIHSVFLHHATFDHGMDVGIANANEMCAISQVEPNVLKACENMVFNRKKDATDIVIDLAKKEKLLNKARQRSSYVATRDNSWRDMEIVQQIEHSFTSSASGIANSASEFANNASEFVSSASKIATSSSKLMKQDVEENRKFYDRPLHIIKDPPVDDGKENTEDCVRSDHMFLPQVMKSVKLMKKAVAYLQKDLRQNILKE